MNCKFRRKNIIKKLKREGLDAFFTAHPVHLSYLCPAFKGEGVLLVTKDMTFLVVDSRFTEQAERELSGIKDIEIVQRKKSMLVCLSKIFAKAGVKSAALEKDHITVDSLEMFRKKCKGVKVHFVKGWVENLRIVKDETEVENIRRACNIVEKVLPTLINEIKWGKMSELDLANELEYRLKKEGSGQLPFQPIVGGGPRAALPHTYPTSALIREGEFLIIDCGASYEGYSSDLTRTVGKNIMDAEKREIYNLVLKVQETAISNIKPGVKTSDLCNLVREMFWEKDVAQFFIHGLGHGVGLDIHEAPSLSSHGSVKLKEGMVITIEPGIYIPNKYGVRIEDTVLVTSKGHEVLTRLPKNSWQSS